MSDLKGTAIRAAKEVVGKSVESLLDPEAIKKAAADLVSGKDHVPTNAEKTREDVEAGQDRKIIGTIGQMADLVHMGEDEKAKAVWEEMKHGVGLEKKKLWGWVDHMGEWTLKHAISWGILPKSFVAMMVGKKKLREATSAEGGAVAKVKGALEGLKAEAQEAKGKVENGKEHLAEWPERFAYMKTQALVVVTEWKGFLSDTGGKQMLEGLKAVEKCISEIDFSQLTEKTRDALMSLWSKDGEKVDPKQVLLLIGEEVKEMRDMGIYVEFKESFNKDPKLKANNLSWKGLNALRSYLEKKGVSKAELEKYDGLVKALNLSDYQVTDPAGWAALMDYVNGLQVNGQAVGCQLEIRDGYYQMLDYSSGNFEHEVLGFARSLPPEKILSLPTVFFGNLAIIKSVENTHELAHAFLDSLSTAVGDTAPKTKTAVARIREAVDRGDLDWEKFMTRPDSSTRDMRRELFTALREDVAGGGVCVAILKGGYIAFRTVAGTYWSYFCIASGSLWDGAKEACNAYRVEGNGIGSSAKAFANEYLTGAAPMIALYGTGAITNALLHGKMNPVGLAKGLGKALVAPVAIVYDAGKIVFKGGMYAARGIKFGYELYQGHPEAVRRARLGWNYYATDDTLLRRFVPRGVRFKIYGDSLNNGLINEIGYLSHRVGYLQEVERLYKRGGELPLKGVQHSLAEEGEALEKVVKKYVLMNFEPVTVKGMWNRVIGKPEDAAFVKSLTKNIVEDFHASWNVTGDTPLRMEQVELRVNELITKQSGLTLTLDRYKLAMQRIDDLEHEKLKRNGRQVGDLESEINEIRGGLGKYALDPGIERIYQAGDDLEQAINAKDKVKIEEGLRKVKALEQTAFDDGLRQLEAHNNALHGNPDIAKFETVMNANLTQERRLTDLINRRVRLVEQMRSAGVEEMRLNAFVTETEQLANRFSSVKVASLEIMDGAYRTLRSERGLKAFLPTESNAFLSLRQNYRRFVMHSPGGSLPTRMFRTMKGHVVVAPIMLLGLYMQYRDIKHSDPDADVIKLFHELGPEAVQMIADIWSPGGISDWYTVYTGKEFVTGREVGGVNRYVTRPLFGLYQVATQGVAIAAAVFTIPEAGAGGAGVEVAASGLRAALTAAGKADKIADIMKAFPRIYSTMQQCGGFFKFAERVRVVGQEFAAGKIVKGVRAGANVAQTAGSIAAIGDIAYQSIGGLMRPVAYNVETNGKRYQPSKEVQEEILASTGDDPDALQLIPSEAKIEHQEMKKAT